MDVTTLISISKAKENKKLLTQKVNFLLFVTDRETYTYVVQNAWNKREIMLKIHTEHFFFFASPLVPLPWDNLLTLSVETLQVSARHIKCECILLLSWDRHSILYILYVHANISCFFPTPGDFATGVLVDLPDSC